jgi:AcrR family transcriptional regulator
MAAIRAELPAVTGRREAHKAATRTAIATAAQELIAERGYDRVTVSDIASTAGVGHRTFYRYYTGKEDAALAALADFFDAYVELVAERPPAEHPMDSLLVALEAVATTVSGDLGDSLIGMMSRGSLLVETVPAVAAHQHWLTVRAQDRLAELFAARDVGADPLVPRWYATAATAAYQAATRTWMRLPADQQVPGALWALGRSTLQAYAAGLR